MQKKAMLYPSKRIYVWIRRTDDAPRDNPDTVSSAVRFRRGEKFTMTAMRLNVYEMVSTSMLMTSARSASEFAKGGSDTMYCAVEIVANRQIYTMYTRASRVKGRKIGSPSSAPISFRIRDILERGGTPNYRRGPARNGRAAPLQGVESVSRAMRTGKTAGTKETSPPKHSLSSWVGEPRVPCLFRSFDFGA
eukprot:scaffold5109_cov238-Pinguiococcus_pyrenoidosus.AAC.2